MVSLVFDASKIPPMVGDEVSFTLGQSRTEMRWVQKRTLAWPEFAKMFESAPTGGKDGTCFTPALFRSFSRKMDQADCIDMIVLDADCGHTADELESAISARGWRAIVHSTFSHLTTETEISAAEYKAWSALNGDDVERYMIEKKGYLARVMAGCSIVEERGKNYVVHHNPCPKYRVIVPLSQSWIASAYDTQQMANTHWRERIHAMAHALQMHPDQSCVDTSRLFYFPRRRDESQPYDVRFIEGVPCPLWSLPESPQGADSLFSERTSRQPLTTLGVAPFSPQARSDWQPQRAAPQPTQKVITAEGFSLTDWAAANADRFEIVTALNARAPGIFGTRVSSGVKFHIECPFDDYHTAVNDRSGTYVINSSALHSAGLTTVNSGFYIGCNHSSCAHRDRLEFVEGMLKRGWLKREDLTDKKFLRALPVDDVKIDAGKLIEKLKSKDSQATSISAPTPFIQERTRSSDGASVPDHVINDLPGMMGAWVEWILLTSHKPQPVLALAAVLVAMSAVIGRKCQVKGWETKPNIFALGILVSGGGKDRPMVAVEETMYQAGASARVGAKDVASDSGIVAMARDQNSAFMLVDEVGFLLSSMNSKQAGSHLANIGGTMLKLYSSSSSIYKSKAYADSGKTFEIHKPNISFFGCSTPDKAYGALQTNDITNGLLSRFMVFDAGERDPLGAPPKQMPLPQSVIDWIKEWEARSEFDPNPMAMVGGQRKITPIDVAMTGDANMSSSDFSEEMHTLKQKYRPMGLDSLFVRAHENALKLALIRASAAGVDNMMIDGTTMNWAIDISRSVTMFMLNIAQTRIADSDYQRKLSTIRLAIQKSADRGLTRAELLRRKDCQMATRDFDGILNHLIQAGEIVKIDTNEGKTRADGHPVKPREAYVVNVIREDD